MLASFFLKSSNFFSVRGSFWNIIFPFVGTSKPEIRLMSVVFPEPLLPFTRTNPDSGNSMFRFFKTKSSFLYA